MIRPGAISLALLALAAALTVSVAVAASGATWHALGHFPEISAPERRQQSAARGPVDLEPILALAPFGVATPAETPLMATSANLILRGVILATPSTQSIALISEAAGVPAAVRIGESAPGGAVLDGVAVNHVVLVVAGRREILSFPETQSSVGVAAIRASIPGANASQSSPQESIDVYRQKIADNPQAVLDEFSVSATPEGYRVSQTPAADVRRAGLQPGDLVVRVNGVAVGDVERDRKLFEDVAASGRARVEVIRGDRLLILSFPLR